MKEAILNILQLILIPWLLLIFLLSLIGCGTYTPPKMASHVVAVTLEGDTILVAIDKIRPDYYRSFYPVYSSYYPYNYPYYNYRNYDYQWRYPDNRGTSSSNNSNNNSNNSASVNSAPDIVTRPSSDVLMKNKN
jgi:hypothetical protein